MPGRTEKKSGGRARDGTERTYPPSPFKGGKRGQNAQKCRPQNAPSRERTAFVHVRFIPSALLRVTLSCTYTCIRKDCYISRGRAPHRRINRLFYSSNVRSILHRALCQDGGVHKERRRERGRGEAKIGECGRWTFKPIAYLCPRLCDPTPGPSVSPSSYLTWRNVG